MILVLTLPTLFGLFIYKYQSFKTRHLINFIFSSLSLIGILDILFQPQKLR